MRKLLSYIVLPYLLLNYMFFGFILLQYRLFNRVVLYSFQFKIIGASIILGLLVLYYLNRKKIYYTRSGIRVYIEIFMLYIIVDLIIKLMWGEVKPVALTYASSFLYFHIFLLYPLLLIFWNNESSTIRRFDNRAWVSLYVVAIPLFLFGFAQYIANDHILTLPADAEYEAFSYRLIDKQIRSLSIFNSGYAYGHFCTWVGVMALGYIIKARQVSKRFKYRRFSYFILLMATMAVITTFTRNILVNFIISIGSIYFIDRHIRRGGKSSSIIIVAFSLGIFLVLGLAVYALVANLSFQGGFISLRTFDQRMSLQALYFTQYFANADNLLNVIFGYGLLQGQRFSELNGSEFIIFDSTYLGVMMFSGVLGLLMYLGFIVQLYRFVMEQYRKTSNYWWLGLSGILFAYPAVSLVNYYITQIILITSIVLALHVAKSIPLRRRALVPV